MGGSSATNSKGSFNTGGSGLLDPSLTGAKPPPPQVGALGNRAGTPGLGGVAPPGGTLASGTSPTAGPVAGGAGTTLGAPAAKPPVTAAAAPAAPASPAIPPGTGGPTPSGQSALPSNVSDTFFNASQTVADAGSQAAGNLGAANTFMANEFNTGINPLEQNLIGSAAKVGEFELNKQNQQIDAQFQDSPFHTGVANAKADASEQFANQLSQLGSQTALQRQMVAGQMSGQPFNETMQAAQLNPSLASNLWNMNLQDQFSALQPILSYYSQFPIATPVVTQGSVIAQPGSRGKKG